jgi:cold shock CspA family protein
MEEDIARAGFRSLNEGAKVTDEAEAGERGPRATSARA